MAIAFDASTNLALGTGDRSFNHTPIGTPRGVVVVIVDPIGTDQVAGVTYGGVAMTQIDAALLGSGETGSAYAFFLGASIPTGTQSVAIDRSDANSYIAACFTVTASDDTEVVDTTTTTSASVANPSVTLTIPAGVSTFICGGLYSGQGAVSGIAEGAGQTLALEDDFGAEIGGISRVTDIQTGGDFVYGWTQAADDAALVGIAIREKAAAPGIPVIHHAPYRPAPRQAA